MNLTVNFNKHFEIVLADTGELIRKAQRLRYQVLCVEHPYLNREHYPDGRECDDYDRRSVHSLILYKATRQVAATVRLVLPDPAFQDAKFPIESYCGGGSSKPRAAMPSFDRSVVGEISRFSISKGFKKQLIGGGGRRAFDAKSRHREPLLFLPLLILGLFKAVLDMSRGNGISSLLALVEPALLRLLNRYGIRFQSFGPLIDFYGKRQPVFDTIPLILQEMRCLNLEVWDFITEGGKNRVCMNAPKKECLIPF